MWNTVTSQRYEEPTGISKHDYEQRLLAAARAKLVGRGAVPSLDEHVESVELLGDGDDICVVVSFGVGHYPGRRFAWRFPIWPVDEPGDQYDMPEGLATLFPVHLGEAINEIASRGTTPPDADGVEWLIWEN